MANYGIISLSKELAALASLASLLIDWGPKRPLAVK